MMNKLFRTERLKKDFRFLRRDNLKATGSFLVVAMQFVLWVGVWVVWVFSGFMTLAGGIAQCILNDPNTLLWVQWYSIFIGYGLLFRYVTPVYNFMFLRDKDKTYE